MQQNLVVVSNESCKNDPAATAMTFGELNSQIIQRKFWGSSMPFSLDEVLKLESAFFEGVTGVVSKYGRKLVKDKAKIQLHAPGISAITSSFDEARCAVKKGFNLLDSNFPSKTDDDIVIGSVSYRIAHYGAYSSNPYSLDFSITPKFKSKQNINEFYELSKVVDAMPKFKC